MKLYYCLIYMKNGQIDKISDDVFIRTPLKSIGKWLINRRAKWFSQFVNIEVTPVFGHPKEFNFILQSNIGEPKEHPQKVQAINLEIAKFRVDKEVELLNNTPFYQKLGIEFKPIWEE